MHIAAWLLLSLPALRQEEFTPKQLQAFVRMGHLMIAAMIYHELEGAFPKSLRDLVEKPKDAKAWPEGGYLPDGKIPKDPWGNDFQYERQERQPKLWTWGADGKEGGEKENRDLTLDDLGTRRGGARMSANEINASASLKTIATAQADFRSNDRDNNRICDFWTGDIAGLYCIDNANTGTSSPLMIKLIERSIALADAAPSPGLTIGGANNYSQKPDAIGKCEPKAGYWYVAMKEDRSTDPPTRYGQKTGNADEDKHNTSRFGVCAYPAEYGKTGTKTFILNEWNTLYWKDTGGKPVEAWPTDEELSRDWKKLE